LDAAIEKGLIVKEVETSQKHLDFAMSLHLAVEMHTKLLDGALDFAGS